MQLILQSEATAARRTVYFVATNSADNTPYTSTLAGADLRVSKAGGAEANSTGTATHVANGLFKYEFATAELDTLGAVALRVAKTGLWGDALVAQVVAFNPYNTASLGLTNLDAAVSTRLPTATYEAPTTVLTSASGVETGLTLQGALRIIVAGLAGRRSGIGTSTELYRDYGNSKSRLTMSFDSNGNTTSVTYDAS